MERKSKLELCQDYNKFGIITSCEVCGKKVCTSCLRGLRDKVTQQVVELRCKKCAELGDPSRYTICK